MADSHYTANIIWQPGEEGREYLVIEYNSGDGVQLKFPGGTNNDRPGETPMETVHREIRREIGFVMPEDPELVWSGPKKPNRDEPGTHQKLAYVIELRKCVGDMRTVPMRDDGGDMLSPPFWATAKELRDGILGSGLKIFPTHLPMLNAAEAYLSKKGN